MAKKVTFSDRYISSLKPEEKMYQEREGRGFGIRVLPSGVKIWLFIYTLNGKRRQMNLGHYPNIKLLDAHKKYRDAFDLVENGIDPQSKIVLPAPTIVDEESNENLDNMTINMLIEKYKIYIEKKLVSRSVKDQYRTLTVDVKPHWGDRLVNDIRRRDAIALLEAKALTAPGQSRNILKTARAMYSFALDREYSEVNPFLGAGRAVPQIGPRSRSRWLSADEIKYVWKILFTDRSNILTYVRRILLLTLITGQRPGEVSSIEWQDIEFGQGHDYCKSCESKCGWWTIPAEKVKTEAHLSNPDPQPFHVYLSPLAVSLLPPKSGDLRRLGTHWVFPTKKANGPTLVTSLSHYTRLKFQTAIMPEWSPHDLRRTTASHLPSLGCIQEYIDRIQNHAIQGSGGVYNRNQYDMQKEEWMMLWSLRLQEICHT